MGYIPQYDVVWLNN
uniref:Uncharacterized protein n=1 Tax=Lepeophtheirus salmonis TaxID=72036 RepID=A0A0K2VEZ3_LEPSM